MHIGLNAQLLSSQPGYRAAGIHQVIHQLLSHLPSQAPPDWRFTAFVGARNTANYDGVTMRRSRWDTESAPKRILWEQLAQPWQQGQFDLAHDMAFVSPLLGSRPSVVTVYDLSFLRYPERLTAARRLYLRLLTGISCQRARRVTAISHSTGQDLSTLLGIAPDKIDVTPLGYDAAVYRPLPPEEIAAFRARHGLPDRFWLFIGTLEPRKNLIMLLKAYAALPRSERLPLILAGGKGWGYAPIFDTIQAYDLAGDVSLPGFLPSEDIAYWYNSAETFLYPSVFEGFGLPVLEAMACGTPVITSNVSSLPEVAGDAGLCLPPDDVDAWTEALRLARSDASWRDQTRHSGLLAAQAFDWKVTARLTVQSYQRALDGSG